jgi:hypothetical protein
MKEVRMRKDSFLYGEEGEIIKIPEAGLMMQAIDTNRALIIEAEKEGGYEKI